MNAMCTNRKARHKAGFSVLLTGESFNSNNTSQYM